MAAKLTETEVRRVAKLSRLELTDAEVARFTSQLAEVLDYIAKLNELDVDDVAPMAHALDVVNVMRDDQPQQPMPVEQALANAAETWPPFFKVPKVLDPGSAA